MTNEIVWTVAVIGNRLPCAVVRWLTLLLLLLLFLLFCVTPAGTPPPPPPLASDAAGVCVVVTVAFFAAAAAAHTPVTVDFFGAVVVFVEFVTSANGANKSKQSVLARTLIFAHISIKNDSVSTETVAQRQKHQQQVHNNLKSERKVGTGTKKTFAEIS